MTEELKERLTDAELTTALTHAKTYQAMSRYSYGDSAAISSIAASNLAIAELLQRILERDLK